MKNVMLSIQPQWIEKIASRIKTVELRKNKPKIELPFKVYIYQSVGKTMFIDVIKDGDDFYGTIHKDKTKILTCPKGLGVSGGKQKVVGEFICDEIIEIPFDSEENRYYQLDSNNGKYVSCVYMKEAIKYGKGKPLYAWHISDLVVYDKPKELSSFYKYCGDYPTDCDKCNYGDINSNESVGDDSYCASPVEMHKPLSRPPQSWGYVEELKI